MAKENPPHPAKVKANHLRPTITDVAKRAGVSPITASRVLRVPEQVSKALQDRVMEAVRELDYVPNLNARALASVRSDAVGVLVPALTQNIFADVLRGIYDGVHGSNLQVQIGNTHFDRAEEERLILNLLRQRPAAMIVSGVDQTPAARAALAEAGCPVVQIMDLTDDPVGRVIGFSHSAAGRAVVEHLIGQSYRRIGFVCGWVHRRSERRIEGYRTTLQEAGLYDPRLIATAEHLAEAGSDRGTEMATVGTGRRLLARLLEIEPRLDAVFCNNDSLALGCLFESQSRGLRVPEDLGIAGFNDFDVMAACHPTLTSVRTPRWKVGFEAALAVRRELEGETSGPKQLDLGFTLVPRDSTLRIPGSA